MIFARAIDASQVIYNKIEIPIPAAGIRFSCKCHEPMERAGLQYLMQPKRQPLRLCGIVHGRASRCSSDRRIAKRAGMGPAGNKAFPLQPRISKFRGYLSAHRIRRFIQYILVRGKPVVLVLGWFGKCKAVFKKILIRDLETAMAIPQPNGEWMHCSGICDYDILQTVIVDITRMNRESCHLLWRIQDSHLRMRAEQYDDLVSIIAQAGYCDILFLIAVKIGKRGCFPRHFRRRTRRLHARQADEQIPGKRDSGILMRRRNRKWIPWQEEQHECQKNHVPQRKGLECHA